MKLSKVTVTGPYEIDSPTGHGLMFNSKFLYILIQKDRKPTLSIKFDPRRIMRNHLIKRLQK